MFERRKKRENKTTFVRFSIISLFSTYLMLMGNFLYIGDVSDKATSNKKRQIATPNDNNEKKQMELRISGI